ncbi:MAG: hypothetical protein PHQ96_08385, partial [Candidatus Omnitrophica bacterium]|nr:hypothetical protein [Candidatus Omnitrophota bacterium]
MPKIDIIKKIPPIHWIATLFNLCLFVAFVAFSISTQTYSFIIAFIAVTASFALLKLHARVLTNLIFFLVMLFMLGQRTLYIGQHIRISPAEAITLYLVFMLFISGKRTQYRFKDWFTVPGAFFIFFTIFGLFTAFYWEKDLDLAFSYVNYLIYSLPALYIIHCIVKEISVIRKIVLLLVFTGFLTSILGLAEYFRLGATSLFPGYFNFESYAVGEEYPRAMAGFWGGPILAAYLVLTLPLAVSAFYVFRGKTALRWMVIVSFVTSTLFI